MFHRRIDEFVIDTTDDVENKAYEKLVSDLIKDDADFTTTLVNNTIHIIVIDNMGRGGVTWEQ